MRSTTLPGNAHHFIKILLPSDILASPIPPYPIFSILIHLSDFIIIGIIFFIIAPYVTLLFRITDDTKKHVIQVLRVMSVVLPLRFYGIVQIIGVLRGGGDVFYAICTELIAVWGIGVPLSFIGVEFFNISITLVYCLTCLEEVFKVIATTPRLLSGKWIKSLVN